MSDVPVQKFRSVVELFEAQVRDEFGHRLVEDVLAPMSAVYRNLSELSAQTRETVSALKTELDRSRNSTQEPMGITL